jgi:hypothetical protein
MKRALFAVALAAVFVVCAPAAFADTVQLKDGTTLQNCFVRDEGVRLLVWEKMADVGTPNIRIIPKSQVKEFKVERDDAWNAPPKLPDLTVSFIELGPKLASFHRNVQYDQWGRPILKGKPYVDLGDEAALKPEEAARKLKLHYTPGEEVTLTAHVKNVGFVAAAPFDYVWLIDGTEIGKGAYAQALPEMQETTFPVKWKWQAGMHTVTFRIRTAQPQIATVNDEVTDPLWGWGYVFIVNKGRLAAWHQVRSSCGTFCWEDYYRWHVDMMNVLFQNSVYPSAPQGIKARVRIDHVIYVDEKDDVMKADASLTGPDGVFYAQGLWIWGGEEETKKVWAKPIPGAYNLEGSLPHELGHQLGIHDWYMLDPHPDMVPHQTWPDNGENVPHFMGHPDTMMHWAGAGLFSEVDAFYFNQTWDKPRGYFGDYTFAIPKDNCISVVDVNGLPVPDARIDIYQRGVVLDPKGQPADDHGAKYFPVVEDGNWGGVPVSKDPVIVGSTDQDGVMRLPNRPAKAVRTFNGFERRPNPFGNVNVTGDRAVMLVKVTKYDRPEYYWLDAYMFNEAWVRGDRDRFTVLLKTPYRSTSSPLPPANVKIEQPDAGHVKATWQAPKMIREQQYLDRVIGYRVYRRIGPMGLNDRPWFPVATLGPDATELTIDLNQKPYDVEWFSSTNRFAVSSLGETSVESELVEAPIPPVKK